MNEWNERNWWKQKKRRKENHCQWHFQRILFWWQRLSFQRRREKHKNYIIAWICFAFEISLQTIPRCLQSFELLRFCVRLHDAYIRQITDMRKSVLWKFSFFVWTKLPTTSNLSISLSCIDTNEIIFPFDAPSSIQEWRKFSKCRSIKNEMRSSFAPESFKRAENVALAMVFMSN